MTPILLSPETEKLLVERMRRDGHESADEAVRAALLVLNDVDEELPDCLDERTLAAIQEASQQVDRGEEIPLDEAFKRLREKHLSK